MAASLFNKGLKLTNSYPNAPNTAGLSQVAFGRGSAARAVKLRVVAGEEEDDSSSATLTTKPVLIQKPKITPKPQAAKPAARTERRKAIIKPRPKEAPAGRTAKTAGLRPFQRPNFGDGGAKSRQKGRAEKKARIAARNESEKSEKVEILEVGESGMSVAELAVALAINEAEVIKTLFMKGIMASITQTLDPDAVKLVAEEFEVEVLDEVEAAVEDAAKKVIEYIDEADLDYLTERPPVCTIMGHVDHGKTSLLDYIRKSKVRATEAGGITQAIGAYQVEVEVGGELKTATFLDTPGHEAFSAMRARGARVTDMTIIVVAADDGVKPQTIEAVSHAKAAGVPILVAINKMDKEGANPERVKQELAEQGLLPEEWGGDVPMIPVSAQRGDGIDELLENMMLQAEVAELQANANREARGTVLEAYLDKNRGATANLLVQAGTLNPGDMILAGAAYGRARAVMDHKGLPLESGAGPSVPVQVLGLNGVPVAGDQWEVCIDESEARSRAEAVAEELRLARIQEQSGGGSMVTLTGLAASGGEGEETIRLNIILKADTSGSVEAIKGALNALPQDKVMLRFLLAAAGDITASDVDLASASGGIVFGFNTPAPEAVEAYAKQQSVEMLSYSIIYDLIDEVRAAMQGLLQPVVEKVPLGEADVLAVFGSGRSRVAGCVVTDGKLTKGCTVQVMREEEMIHEGLLSSLRRLKDNVKEVSQGTECGAGCSGFADWKEDDKILAFELVTKNQSLSKDEPNTEIVPEEE
eukprot:gene2698-3472_t